MFSTELSTRSYYGHAVVISRGELDLADAVDVAAALTAISAREPRIIVDLAGLEFIDSSGLGALARGRRQARRAGGEVGRFKEGIMPTSQRPCKRRWTGPATSRLSQPGRAARVWDDALAHCDPGLARCRLGQNYFCPQYMIRPAPEREIRLVSVRMKSR